MQAYRMHESEIEVPDDWVDNSMNSFVAKAQPASKDSINFVVTRDVRDDIDTVKEYGDQQLVEAAKQLKKYKLDWKKDGTIDGEPAVQVSFSWVTPDRNKVQQRQVYVKHMDRYLIFTVTTMAEGFKQYEEKWNQILGSIKLRREE